MRKYGADFFSVIGIFLWISISKRAKMQFFHKKCVENLVNSKKSSTFALAFEKDTLFVQSKFATIGRIHGGCSSIG